MNEIQTPRKELLHLSSNRKVKSSNSQSKKLNHLQQKIVKKSLNSVFTPENDVSYLSEKNSSQILSISASVDDDQLTAEVCDNTVRIQHPDVSAEISSLSDAFVPYHDPACESREFQSSIESSNQFISPSSVNSGLVETSPASSTITTESATGVFDTSDESKPEEMTSFETESLVKLRESIFQVLHPDEIKSIPKKLLDELAKMETQICYGVHEESGMTANLFSRKERILLLSFVLGILAVLARIFLLADVQSSYYVPPPT